MLKKFLPWRFLIKRSAKRFGIIDPVNFLARLRRFSQPSEVQEPIELLRAGIIFHARGLINTKAIQYNLDWVWPFWVEKQFNPEDPSFIPRGFSFSHINMTHRNWTAVGLPDLPLYPIVDPRGMVTPLHDGWSLDFWIITKSGNRLIPSKLKHADQKLTIEDNLVVKTFSSYLDMNLVAATQVVANKGEPEILINLKASSDEPAYLAVTVRPYNPEGVQFVETIEWDDSRHRLYVNDDTEIIPAENPDKVLFSNYNHGDVLHKFQEAQNETKVKCNIGMATAVMLFEIDENQKEVNLRIPLQVEYKKQYSGEINLSNSWPEILEKTAELSIPDEKIKFLYDSAIRSMILLSADKVVPGPYTYKRFWIRDAAYMINTLLAIGCEDRAKRLLEDFFELQKRNGYFQSQEGEWDSNGQALWILARYHQLTRREFDKDWLKAINKATKWIRKKRVDAPDKPHDGLLPPGFSAEHLGPNDYFYWDDFWSIAGLKAIAKTIENHGQQEKAREVLELAKEFEQTVFKSIDSISNIRKKGGIPASPYRRMDSGAVGSLVADYPLQITPPGNSQINNTVEFLLNNCFRSGGFFQDMIHSGINAYLSLEIAQTLLRKRDQRYREIIDAVAELATTTGQWPEAIHPLTLGGCMGDGQHGWAAAEWIMMIRNLFVREEEDKLILGAGIFPKWLNGKDELSFGPTSTPHGKISVRFYFEKTELFLDLKVNWHNEAPAVIVNLPGYQEEKINDFDQPFRLKEI
ncbi:MAG: hypothetical protein ACLFQM_10125 [Fidelibacterota bacterium]